MGVPEVLVDDLSLDLGSLHLFRFLPVHTSQPDPIRPRVAPTPTDSCEEGDGEGTSFD